MSDKQIPIPAIAAEKGMTRLVFEDDFDSIDTIDLYGTGDKKYKWYTTRPFRAAPLKPDDVKVENSVLTVCNEDPMYNWGIATINPREGGSLLLIHRNLPVEICCKSQVYNLTSTYCASNLCGELRKYGFGIGLTSSHHCTDAEKTNQQSKYFLHIF